MQVDFNAINAVTKEITITVPADEVNKDWGKFLSKAARSVDVPGFRKGKAPLAMVERMHGETLVDHFYKDAINDYFEAAATEHKIHYLLFPDVKDIQWEKGSEMLIKIEIEHEPILDFTQLDGLSVPHTPITIDSEVDKYLSELVHENGRVVDVEEAIENDEVQVEIKLEHSGEELVLQASLFAGTNPESRSLESLIGKRTGDTLTAELAGKTIKLVAKDAKLSLGNEHLYPVSIIVGGISRVQYPTLDDAFARDLEFEDLASMKAKIEDDLSLKNEHKNIDADNFAVIHKLYVDNHFDLPKKTIEYLAKQEAEKSPYKQYMQFLEYQYRMQISQEMVTMYVLSNLRNKVELEVTDDMVEEYIQHEAILADQTFEAYKERNRAEIETEDYKIGVRNYFILRKIASTSTFYIAEPPEENEETAQNVSYEEVAQISEESVLDNAETQSEIEGIIDNN